MPLKQKNHVVVAMCIGVPVFLRHSVVNIGLLLNSRFRLDDWFSLLVLGRRRLSILSFDVLCPSAQPDWSVVITVFVFYTAGAGFILSITWLPLS